MRELEVLDGGHLKLCWEERKAFFEEELSEQVRGEVKRLLEEALEAERTDWLGVGRYVRDEAGRRDYRNGYYRRDLGTRLGLVRGLRVPRTRSGCPSQLLSRYQRRQESVNELGREAECGDGGCWWPMASGGMGGGRSSPTGWRQGRAKRRGRPSCRTAFCAASKAVTCG